MMPTVKVDTKVSISTVSFVSIKVPSHVETDRIPVIGIYVYDIFKKKLRKIDIT